MHFEVLIEDQSGKAAMEILLPKLIGDNDSFRIIPYKGIGRIPKNLKPNSDAKKRSLLNRLPGIIKVEEELQICENYQDCYGCIFLISCT
jgi:hypothetical protein